MDLPVFLLATLTLLLIFRVLSSSRLRIPDGLRLALGMLAIYAVLITALWYDFRPGVLLGVAVAAAIGTVGMYGDGLTRLTDALGRMRLPLYLLSVAAMSALILLVVPITTFLTSPGELNLHLGYLVSVNARDAMLMVYVAAMLYMLAFTARMRTLLTVLALTALVLTIIYTYAAPLGYPAMAGLTLEQVPQSTATIRWRAVFDGALILLITPALCWALLRFKARQFLIGIVLVKLSLAIVVAARISTDRVGEAGGAEGGLVASERPLQFSRTEPNVLIVFLDRFMGSFVESILQDHPDLNQRLSGFTWYPRTIAAGYNSIAGVHPMLGGYDYTPLEMNTRHQPLSKLSAEAFSILPYNFARHGYRVNMVGPRGMGFTLEGDCRSLQIEGVTCSHVPMSGVKSRAEQLGFGLNDLAMANYADLLVLLGSMRSAPYALKAVLYERGPWRPFMDQSAATTFREWAQLQSFAEISSTSAEQSNFNFISNLLPHQPVYMGEDCLPRSEPYEVSKEELQRRGFNHLLTLQHYVAARCSLLAVADYLDFLKSSGVYDNTKIVIVSDHGIAASVADHSSRAIAGGTTASKYVGSRSVLLVKERNASGNLQVSETFTPNAEVPRIVCEEIAGCVNPYLNNKPIVTDGRDDPFYVSIVPWQFTAQKPQAFVIQTQFVVRGKDPYDASGWSELE
ncbi:sulfatase-like hydrolase/transferase [Steroidobacter sp. S1-65]|uniref:Sulfatase-like hydrolase/transferase n=1 Tax=Steroidobacter gossypii TaxID=2805490 RepID=A0ABS1X4S8_9GAMM|nr:sulfatase-like hydrolase/transferase [Steroidobacter gossypii]MBM0108242.1 sulfatase-like hydrolase/transferase [Steroidobacter gossypii]